MALVHLQGVEAFLVGHVVQSLLEAYSRTIGANNPVAQERLLSEGSPFRRGVAGLESLGTVRSTIQLCKLFQSH